MDENFDAVLAKFKAKGTEQSCPVCLADAPYEFGSPADAKTFLTVVLADGSATALHVLPLICCNCGYVRLHSLAHLLSDD